MSSKFDVCLCTIKIGWWGMSGAKWSLGKEGHLPLSHQLTYQGRANKQDPTYQVEVWRSH